MPAIAAVLVSSALAGISAGVTVSALAGVITGIVSYASHITLARTPAQPNHEGYHQ